MRTETRRTSPGTSRWAAGVRKRALVIVALVVSCIWAIYPPGDSIKLGLDLKGGVHLVLQVRTDEALAVKTQSAVDRLKAALTEHQVAFTRIEASGATRFRVEGIEDDQALRSLSEEADAFFDREGTDGTHTFRMKPESVRVIREDTVQQARHTIERRVNELGVTEALVARYGEDDRILVELPGVAAVDRAKRIISSTAQLRLTLVDRGPFATREAALQAYGNRLPADLQVLPGPARDPGAHGPAYYVIRKVPVVSGSDVRDARPSVDDLNRPAVAFTLERGAGLRFGAFTERHVNRLLATVLDDRVTSVATILSRIEDRGQIEGLTREEMLEQVITFKSGALPADLEYVEERTVGASLGEASIRSGVLASAGGLALVGLFMLAYYRRAGLIALVSIVLNLLILVALAALIPVTMTLPGIAGLILTVGMGVDSSVLIFERIREELRSAGTERSAVTAGFDRAWITIVDTHVTSLIAAAFLYQFGTSPIRGFATTLTIGLVANVFTAVFASRTAFELLLRHRRAAAGTMGLFGPARVRTDVRFAFSRWRWHAVLLSAVLVGAGALAIAARGLPLGLDFSGGTLVVVEFAQPGVTEGDVRDAVAVLPGDEIVQRYGPAADRQFLIRLPLARRADETNALEADARSATRALEASGLPAFRIVNRELVSASVGDDLQWRGIQAAAASLAAIAIYIAARFRFSFAVGAIAATIHDVLVTVACLAIAGYDLTLNVTAALLTIIGYSVNDTIVIFDRVRENARAVRGAPLGRVIDSSVTQTLSRTLITAGTTLLAVLSLYLFGGEPLGGFAFTMLVGIVSGTYSTVFIASSIAAAGGNRLTRPSEAGRQTSEHVGAPPR